MKEIKKYIANGVVKKELKLSKDFSRRKINGG